jgi:hypothetical protein
MGGAIDMTLRRLQVEWLADPNAPSVDRCTQLANPSGKLVLAVRHKTNARVFLGIDLAPGALLNPQVARIELIQHNTDGSITRNSSIPFSPGQGGQLSVTFDMTDILAGLNTSVNTNLVEARVTIAGGGQTLPVFSSNLLHMASQKVVLFLPGVAGSEIVTAGFPNELSFPTWSVGFPFGVNEFERLNCDRAGLPVASGQSVRVRLLEKFTALKIVDPITIAVKVYDVRNRKEMSQATGHPLLRKPDGTLLLHYNVVPWPYDWRLRLESAVEFLLGNTPFGANVGAPLPSITKVLADAQATAPLLDDKIVIAGHSTGGVIVRGLLSRPEAANLVSKAFFMNVPFFGAPKAYFVYLTGEFLPFIAEDLLRRMAPNLPIVYYLAPTERYPDPVARLPSGQVIGRRPGQNVGNEIVKPLVALMAEKYPDTLPRWNDALEAAARTYHASITTPVIGWDKCVVYFSRTAPNQTPGPVFTVDDSGGGGGSEGAPGAVFDGKNVARDDIAGDATVPEASLKGDSPANRQRQISGGPDHTGAPSTSFVWLDVAGELSRDR